MRYMFRKHLCGTGDISSSIGFWNDEYGMLTKLHWLVWEQQAWRYVEHIEKVLPLTHCETLIALIVYGIIANQLWCKHVVYQYYRFGHHN